jgi:hypothetical protein
VASLHPALFFTEQCKTESLGFQIDRRPLKADLLQIDLTLVSAFYLPDLPPKK